MSQHSTNKKKGRVWNRLLNSVAEPYKFHGSVTACLSLHKVITEELFLDNVYIFFNFSQIYNLLYNGAISKYVVRKHLCGAIIYEDSHIYTVHYVVRAPILLPLSGPLSQRAIIVLVCV
jgi:hypothetical protein